MQIVRVTEQGPQSVTEFYREILDSETGTCMLQLLDEIALMAPGSFVWGCTSHYSLSLLAQDSTWPDHDLIVAIHPPVKSGWHITCPLPRALAPWPKASVSGSTTDFAEAVRRVRLAFFWAKLLPTP